jgi:hypothetical protein
MTRVATFINTKRPEAVELAKELVSWIEFSGHTCVLLEESAVAIGREDLAVGEKDIGEISSTEDSRIFRWTIHD